GRNREIAVVALVRVVEAGAGVRRARICLTVEADRGRAAFADGAVVRQCRGRCDVADRHDRVVLGDPPVLVLELALHRATSVVVRRASRAAGSTVRAVARATVEGVVEAGGHVGGARISRASEREVDPAAFDYGG